MATPIPQNRAALTAWEAAAATGGRVARAAGGRTAHGVVSDSRAVGEGSAFVALRGEHHDGHAFLADVAKRGAALVVVQEGADVPAGPDVVTVPDTLAAWGDLARAHLRAWRRSREGRDPARLIAITGSAGKTTTKELCAALLATVAPTFATPGNLNNLVGVPAVAFCIEPAHRFAVLEMGMSVRGEIARLAAVGEPDVAVVTNAGAAHAEGVGGGPDDVAREKGALYAALAPEGVAVANADDPIASGQLARTRARRAVLFGRAAGARYRLEDRVARGAEGSRVTLRVPCRDACPSPDATDVVELDLPLVGEAAAIDLCAALAAAEAAAGHALALELVAQALAGVRNVGGRAATVGLADGTLVIDDTYNANPESMRAALGTLADLAGERRRVAVLGEMKELGAASEAEHDALGDALAGAGVTVAIGCGGLAERTLARAGAAGVNVYSASDAAAAAALAARVVRPGDVVLVKASRSVGAERVVAALVASRGRQA